MQENASDPYSLYVYSLKSPVTRERYTFRLGKFFGFLGIEGSISERCRLFVEKARDAGWLMESVMRFFQHQKERVERKEISGATVQNFLKCVKLFLEVNDIPFAWKKIKRGLPKGRRHAEDRAPSLEEIRRLIQYPDRRIRAIVLVAASSGIRIGAWDYLKWKDIQPILRNGELVAARITIYRGEEEEHFSYITPEAYAEVKSWMDYRQQSGEPIGKESWLMRDLWDTRVAEGRGLASVPKRLKSSGVKRLLERAMWAQGLRKKLEPGSKRHDFSASHSFRKYFHTMCGVAGVKPAVAELMLGHSIGLGSSYFKPIEQQMLDGYLAAVPLLTVSETEEVRRQLVQSEERHQSEIHKFMIC